MSTSKSIRSGQPLSSKTVRLAAQLLLTAGVVLPVFASHVAFAQGPQCQELFTAAPKRVTAPTQKPEITLTELSQRLRKALIETGPVDTTRLRSEFKHYNLESDADRIIAQLKAEFPPVYSQGAALTSGLASRDEKVKVSKDQIIQALSTRSGQNDELSRQLKLNPNFGVEMAAVLEKQGLMKTVSDPDVLAQHRDVVAKAVPKVVLDTIDRLHSSMTRAMKARGKTGYTDTASTEKFRYINDLTETAIAEAATLAQPPITGLTPELITSIRTTVLARAKASISGGDEKISLGDIRKALTSAGNKSSDVDSYLSNIEDRAFDAGVIRYRKYRTGAQQTTFEGLAAPGSEESGHAKGISDAAFAKEVTWLEFKMKASNGEESLSTVVNKPRFPVSDETFPVLKDPKNFISDRAFAKTSAILKQNIKTNVDRMKAMKIEASFTDAETDSMLELVRSLHLQKFNFSPVTRTVYMRDSYNINLLDVTGKSHNVQITRDRQVWQLDRQSGLLRQALPFYESINGWNFQYEADSGWYVHRDPDSGEVMHLMNPYKPEEIFDYNARTRKNVLPRHRGAVNPKPVEVVELKVPLEFIRLTDQDVARVPDLAKVRAAKKDMVDSTSSLNELRSQVSLPGFQVNLGKSGTARKDTAGGLRLRISSNGRTTGKFKVHEFSFNPETGYWMNWDGDVPKFFFKPSTGLMSITDPRSADWRKEAVPALGFVEDAVYPSYDEFKDND